MQKLNNNKLCLCFLCQALEMLHDVQKLDESGVPYIHFLNITGGIYFIGSGKKIVNLRLEIQTSSQSKDLLLVKFMYLQQIRVMQGRCVLSF